MIAEKPWLRFPDSKNTFRQNKQILQEGKNVLNSSKF